MSKTEPPKTPTGSAISTLPSLIEFVLIEDKNDMDDVAKRFLGPLATRKDFAVKFNILLEDYTGFYGEIGTVDAPEGPLMGKNIAPILGLRITQGGNCKAHILKAPGLCHLSGKTAWVKIKDWDEVVGDDLQDKVDKLEQARRESSENQKRMAEEARASKEQAEDAKED